MSKVVRLVRIAVHRSVIKMKTSYILKTSNDLTFEFNGNELLWDYWSEEFQLVESIFNRNYADFPIKLAIDDVDYLINYFSKVKQI